MKNRFIIALLIMVLTGMFLSIHAMAEPELPNADPEMFECYSNGDGTWTVAYYNGQDPNVNLAIPITYDELEGGVITIIDKSAFHNQYYFTGRLIIPESIVEIRKRAFEGCYGLSGDFIIPDSVEIIGEHAFDGCTGFSGESAS